MGQSPGGVVDVQRGQLPLLGRPGHVQDGHPQTLLLVLVGVGDLHQAVDKVVPPLHTDETLLKVAIDTRWREKQQSVHVHRLSVG